VLQIILPELRRLRGERADALDAFEQRILMYGEILEE